MRIQQQVSALTQSRAQRRLRDEAHERCGGHSSGKEGERRGEEGKRGRGREREEGEPGGPALEKFRPYRAAEHWRKSHPSLQHHTLQLRRAAIHSYIDLASRSSSATPNSESSSSDLTALLITWRFSSLQPTPSSSCIHNASGSSHRSWISRTASI